MSSATRLAMLIILLSALSTIYCATQSSELEEESRGKKKGKHSSLLIALLVLKAIIFPMAFKAMAFMSSIAVVLSVLSLLTSSILGYTRVATSEHYPPSYKHVYLPRYKKRNDFIIPDGLEDNQMIATPDTNEELVQFNQNNPQQRTSPYYYNNYK